MRYPDACMFYHFLAPEGRHPTWEEIFIEKNIKMQAGHHRIADYCSDSFTILGLWVLGLAVSHINESSCKRMSQEHYFNDNSEIIMHPGTR